MKKITNKFKISFAQGILATAVKVSSSINKTMSRKFDQLSSRLNEVDIRDTDAKTPTDDNGIRMGNLAVERNNSNLKLEECIRRPWKTLLAIM